MLSESILERTQIYSSDDEIKRLAEQMQLISEYGMDKLNTTLLDNTKNSSRNFLDFIAEHNFGTDLIRFLGTNQWEYEPEGYKRPIDFVLRRPDRTYYLQMKNLSSGERENRRRKLIELIKKRFQDIHIEKFISLSLSEDFNEHDVMPFISYLKSNLPQLHEGIKHTFTRDGEVKAAFRYFPAKTTKLYHLTVGVTGDLEAICVTGESEQQVKNSLTKAIGAFDWDNDESHINLIVLEADRIDDITISQAVFGTELFIFTPNSRNGPRAWKRDSDGFFNIPEHSSRISGVIAIRRTSQNIISNYKKTLFINDRFLQMIEPIKTVVDVNEILTYRDLAKSE